MGGPTPLPVADNPHLPIPSTVEEETGPTLTLNLWVHLSCDFPVLFAESIPLQPSVHVCVCVYVCIDVCVRVCFYSTYIRKKYVCV